VRSKGPPPRGGFGPVTRDVDPTLVHIILPNATMTIDDGMQKLARSNTQGRRHERL
jgi:hypothetical protein